MSVLRRTARLHPAAPDNQVPSEFPDSPSAGEVLQYDSKEMLRRIAHRHRDVNVAILLALAVMAVYYFGPISPIVEHLPFWRFWLLAIVLLVGAMQSIAALRCASELCREIGLPMLAAVTQFAPGVSILVMGISHQPGSLASISFYSSAVVSIAFLAIVSYFGCSRLEKNGLKPGLMGLDPKTI